MERRRHSLNTPPAVNGRRRRTGRRSAFTLIEILAASVIVGTCVAAIVSMWAFAFGLSATADRQSIGYSLGRGAVEQVKQTGFQDTAEGTATVYYDAQGGSRSAVQTNIHDYSVTTVVATDLMNGASPAPSALRTVTVTVRFVGSGASAYTCGTYLARAGI